MTSLEIILARLDKDAVGMAWRFILGFAIIPLFGMLPFYGDSLLLNAALFACVLVALRVIPAIFRFTMPVPPKLKEIWKKRRFIAKEYDSYQWRKLFWIGLGMLPHVFFGPGLNKGALAVCLFCLASGGAAQIVWHFGGGPQLTAE